MNCFTGCDLAEFADLIRYAREKEEDEHIRAQWIALLPFMSIDMLKYMPYKEYKEKCQGKNIDLRPTDEIIKEIEELHGKGDKNGNI